jgi:hypothetical protein
MPFTWYLMHGLQPNDSIWPVRVMFLKTVSHFSFEHNFQSLFIFGFFTGLAGSLLFLPCFCFVDESDAWSLDIFEILGGSIESIQLDILDEWGEIHQ